MMTPTFSRGFPASVRGDPVFACRFDSPHPDDGDHGPPAERTDPHRLHGRPGKSDHRGGRSAHRENLKIMIIASQKTTGAVPLTEQVLSPQKLLTEAIVAMGREIDNRWKRTSSSRPCSISSRTRWSRSAVRGRRSRSCFPRRDTKTRGQYLIGHGEA